MRTLSKRLLVLVVFVASALGCGVEPGTAPDTEASLAGDGAGRSSHHHYVFKSFDPPGSVLTFPTGINNNGLISIQYVDAAGQWHAATLKHGRYTFIDMPGESGTLAGAPNMQGQVPLAYVTQDGTFHQAVYSRGNFTVLPDAPGFANISPSGMNARGHICGVVWTDTVTVYAYLWNGSAFTVFAYPADGVVFTACAGFNNHDQIVGQYNTSDGLIHGFLKEGDSYTEIAFPGETSTAALSINNSGVIVGQHGNAGPGPFGFAIGSGGFVLRHGVYSPLDYPGAPYSFPLGINDTGQIVGTWQDDTGTLHGYLATRL
jgi:uncharacterized membrane protein